MYKCIYGCMVVCIYWMYVCMVWYGMVVYMYACMLYVCMFICMYVESRYGQMNMNGK